MVEIFTPREASFFHHFKMTLEAPRWPPSSKTRTLTSPKTYAREGERLGKERGIDFHM